MWFHTAAMITSNIAWSPSITQFQCTPRPFSQNVTMPIDGANRNAYSTPATAAATAYGQISRVL